jgi:hypothetical protein
MPIPFRGPGAASLPRFRADIGAFIALASGASLYGATGGFEDSEQKGRMTGSLDVGARLGIGLEGLLGESGDGQLFIQAGVLMAARERSACSEPCEGVPPAEQLLPRVPARTGLAFRLRAPFWLLPGDLILAAPILAFTAPNTLKKMGITAANGGLIPWQTGLATPFGRFQVVAGREVGVTLFGYIAEDNLLTRTGTSPGGTPIFTAVRIKSIQYDFPLVEYRPFRTFSTGQSFAMNVQFGVGFDRPVRVEVLAPVGAPVPVLKTRYLGFLKIAFDGRHYF